MFWIGLAVYMVAVGWLLCLVATAERDNDALLTAVRPTSRCYISGDTEAEIAEKLLGDLERVA